MANSRLAALKTILTSVHTLVVSMRQSREPHAAITTMT